jgi:hypothetical protein
VLEQLPYSSKTGEVVRVYNAPPEFGSFLRREVGNVSSDGRYIIESADWHVDDFGKEAYDLVLKPIGSGVAAPFVGIAALFSGCTVGVVSVCRGCLGACDMTVNWLVKPYFDRGIDETEDALERQFEDHAFHKHYDYKTHSWANESDDLKKAKDSLKPGSDRIYAYDASKLVTTSRSPSSFNKSSSQLYASDRRVIDSRQSGFRVMPERYAVEGPSTTSRIRPESRPVWDSDRYAVSRYAPTETIPPRRIGV